MELSFTTKDVKISGETQINGERVFFRGKASLDWSLNALADRQGLDSFQILVAPQEIPCEVEYEDSFGNSETTELKLKVDEIELNIADWNIRSRFEPSNIEINDNKAEVTF